MAPAIDWDQVPDDELYETYLERVAALKEMFPMSVRQKVHNTVDWSTWAAKKTVSFSTQILNNFNFSFPSHDQRCGLVQLRQLS